jgi:hypothetical protein
MIGSRRVLFHKLESTMKERVCCAESDLHAESVEIRLARHVVSLRSVRLFLKGWNDGARMDVHERSKSRTSRFTNFEVHQLQDSTSLCGS